MFFAGSLLSRCVYISGILEVESWTPGSTPGLHTPGPGV
jgi:hypothetical protein